jgi:NADPH-dependent curcumin reductase CurA
VLNRKELKVICFKESGLDEGRLTIKEIIINGFNKFPETFMGLFEGRNTRKMLVEIA